MCTFYVIAIRLANEKSSDKEDQHQAGEVLAFSYPCSNHGYFSLQIRSFLVGIPPSRRDPHGEEERIDTAGG